MGKNLNEIYTKEARTTFKKNLKKQEKRKHKDWVSEAFKKITKKKKEDAAWKDLTEMEMKKQRLTPNLSSRDGRCYIAEYNSEPAVFEIDHEWQPTEARGVLSSALEDDIVAHFYWQNLFWLQRAFIAVERNSVLLEVGWTL